MIIISHRGNLNGPCRAKENTISYIETALMYFDVEIDVWMINGNLYLGHDDPDQLISENFLTSNSERLWIHCKNIQALEMLKEKDVNCFGHSKDDFVLTSKGYIFTLPGTSQSESSVTVMPEIANSFDKPTLAVCTDYPQKYKNETYNNLIRKQ